MMLKVGLAFALLMVGWGSVRAEVLITEQERRYVLDASTLREMVDQLVRYHAQPSRDDAVRSHGLTEASIETRYELDPREDGACGLRELRVVVHIVRTLPEWKPVRDPGPVMDERVSRMLRGLAEHEEGHRRHVLASAATIERKLAELAVMPDCLGARRAAERVVSRESIRLRMREINYDLATDNGRTQGALLQLDREVPTRHVRGSRIH